MRELESMVSRYILTGDLSAIEDVLAGPCAPAASGGGRSVLQDREVQALSAALSQTGWNQRQAAKLLGIGYSALRRRLAKYELARPGVGTY